LSERIRKSLSFCTAVIAAAVLSAPAGAYESDQLTNRAQPIEDSTAVLNREVNAAIAEIVAGWRKGHDEMAVVNAIYRSIGGVHWVDRIERWAMKSDEIDHLDIPRYDSVFSGQPFWALRVTAVFGVGKTILVDGQLIGTDKLGHFISQGRKYYRRFRKSGSEAQAAEHSAFTERAIFGQMTNGIYSNADLVANYEGHRFYRSLFEDGIVAGKPAILRWEDGGWVIQRQFDWADHVNEYWDEALNVNHFDALLYPHMRQRLLGYCGDYFEAPELYDVDNEPALLARYGELQLRDTSELRLSNLCPAEAPEAGVTGTGKGSR
jgi:hypothetical protein